MHNPKFIKNQGMHFGIKKINFFLNKINMSRFYKYYNMLGGNENIVDVHRQPRHILTKGNTKLLKNFLK